MNDEIRDLLARALAGDLSPEESDRFLDLCRRDDRVRMEFGRMAITDRLLRAAHADSNPEMAAREVAKRLSPPVPFADERGLITGSLQILREEH